MQNRREFLFNAMMAGAAGAVAGCSTARVAQCGGMSGAPMIGFRCKPMPVIDIDLGKFDLHV